MALMRLPLSVHRSSKGTRTQTRYVSTGLGGRQIGCESGEPPRFARRTEAHLLTQTKVMFLVASLLLVAGSDVLVTSSFLLLVVKPGAPSSVRAPK